MFALRYPQGSQAAANLGATWLYIHNMVQLVPSEVSRLVVAFVVRLNLKLFQFRSVPLSDNS